MRCPCSALVAIGLLLAASEFQPAGETRIRVLSWNVSGRAPVEQPDMFRGHLQLAEPDVVLLDEVDGSLAQAAVGALFKDVPGRTGNSWTVLWGQRGGRQRIVMAARSAIDVVAEFQRNVYPPPDIDAVVAAAEPEARDRLRRELGNGIPVNAATLQTGNGTILLVAIDLQCCGGRWQEIRRLAEARHVRQLVAETIQTVGADGVILTGDFNLAAPPPGTGGTGVLPLVVLSGPYPPPIHGLIAAEALHRDGQEAWTINSGDTSGFPHLPFDFQLYSPHSLRAVDAYVLDTADYSERDLDRAGLNRTASAELSTHRPVVVTYEWRDRPLKRRGG
ncbi:MAG TPA: endonuclease/exonuclease/phosphatase family protein [Vicinamibacterales bacterium]|nr:endonuclease/exonuclease/phosphatase family protein [Vicinamibacterales bacterium]